MALFPLSPAIAPRGIWRIVALAAVALAIATTVACGASSPPDPAQPPADVAPAEQPGAATQGSSQPMADRQAPGEPSPSSTGASAGAAPATRAQPVTAQPVGDPPVSPETTSGPDPEAAAYDQQPLSGELAGQDAAPAADTASAIAVVVQPEPAEQPAESQDAQASQAPPVGASPANPADAPAVQPPPPATAAPASTQPPAPTAPAPTAPPAPVVQEPLPDIGHQVGNRIPDITLELFGGSTVSTGELVEQGKPTFLFFTATT